jgi:hypothetical protein
MTSGNFAEFEIAVTFVINFFVYLILHDFWKFRRIRNCRNIRLLFDIHIRSNLIACHIVQVVSCGAYSTGDQRHDQRDFVWTLHKNKEDWENSTK